MKQIVPPCILQSQYACMAAKISPFNPDQIAMAFADNFGLGGKGRLLIGNTIRGKPMGIQVEFTEHDAIFDCSWSEADANILISGCGDGEVKVWDIGGQKLMHTFHESKDEVQSVEFSHKQTQLFLTSNMNGMTRLYDMMTQKVVSVFQSHKKTTYQSLWHPVQGSMFATCGGDGALRIWDLNSQYKNVASVQAHQQDCMACDFNKYEEQIATASSDKSIKIWDLRNLKAPINVLLGHRHPIKRIKFSPHEAQILGSVSYDMTFRIWDSLQISSPELKMHAQNSEFVVALDFSIHREREVAFGSWDGKVIVCQWDQELQI